MNNTITRERKTVMESGFTVTACSGLIILLAGKDYIDNTKVSF